MELLITWHVVVEMEWKLVICVPEHYIMFLLEFYCYCAIMGGGGQKNPFLEPFATYNGAKIEYTISIETLRNVSVRLSLLRKLQTIKILCFLLFIGTCSTSVSDSYHYPLSKT